MTTRYRRQSMDSLTQISDVDYCNECDKETNIMACNKCASAVCTKGKCCLLFPHYHDSLYVICRTCSIKIEKKLQVLVDLDKLVLLKRKIKKLQQENRKLRHSV